MAIVSSTPQRRTPTSAKSGKGCANKSAGKLGVDHLDLLLLHQPLPSRFDLTLDAYRALEKLLADGKVRAIGVSNFMPEHLRRLLAEAAERRLG